MSYTIDIIVEDGTTLTDPTVEDTVLFALQATDTPPGEVSISFVSDGTIRALNKQYRDLDEPTDVLSFAQEEEGFIFHPTRVLGDIVISLETMQRNALLFDVEPDVELKRLLIHGVLHLLGHDHQTNGEDEEMLLLQEEILRNLLRSTD